MSRTPLLPIFLIVMVDLLALTMIVPLLPFFAQSFGASAFEVGLLASSFAICHLAGGPVLRMHFDRLCVLFAARVFDGLTAGNMPVPQAAISGLTEPKDRAKAFGTIGVVFGIGLIQGPTASGLLAAFDWVYPVDAAAGLAPDRPRSADLVGAGAVQRPGPDYRGINLQGR